MSEKKQTAVMWLKERLPSLFIDDSGHYEELFQQALQMYREQIEEAYNQGDVDGYHFRKDNQYYINNYGE